MKELGQAAADMHQYLKGLGLSAGDETVVLAIMVACQADCNCKPHMTREEFLKLFNHSVRMAWNLHDRGRAARHHNAKKEPH